MQDSISSADCVSVLYQTSNFTLPCVIKQTITNKSNQGVRREQSIPIVVSYSCTYCQVKTLSVPTHIAATDTAMNQQVAGTNISVTEIRFVSRIVLQTSRLPTCHTQYWFHKPFKHSFVFLSMIIKEVILLVGFK